MLTSDLFHQIAIQRGHIGDSESLVNVCRPWFQDKYAENCGDRILTRHRYFDSNIRPVLFLVLAE